MHGACLPFPGSLPGCKRRLLACLQLRSPSRQAALARLPPPPFLQSPPSWRRPLQGSPALPSLFPLSPVVLRSVSPAQVGAAPRLSCTFGADSKRRRWPSCEWATASVLQPAAAAASALRVGLPPLQRPGSLLLQFPDAPVNAVLLQLSCPPASSCRCSGLGLCPMQDVQMPTHPSACPALPRPSPPACCSAAAAGPAAAQPLAAAGARGRRGRGRW